VITEGLIQVVLAAMYSLPDIACVSPAAVFYIDEFSWILACGGSGCDQNKKCSH